MALPSAPSPYAIAQTPRMLALINTFPVLGRRDFRSWDPVAFREWVENGGPSYGEKLTGQFILSVWDPENYFDVHAALKKWDDEHLAAFLAWAKEPWWP